MHEKIKEALNDLYNSYKTNSYEVYNIFKDFFTEERVDYQGDDLESFLNKIGEMNTGGSDSLKFKDYIPSNENDPIFTTIQKEKEYKGLFNINVYNDIIVWFPEVKVTNENNKSTIIYDLYVKVPITNDGRLSGNFSMNRSTYTEDQLYSDYMHSHVRGINYNDTSRFLNPCLGTGPIRNTEALLIMDYSEHVWKLFCLELQKYVETESLQGIPYRKLETIGITDKILKSYYNLTFVSRNKYKEIPLKEYVEYIIDNNILKFNYSNNVFNIAMPFVEYIVKMSNAFIEWYNKLFNEGKAPYNSIELFRIGLIRKGIVKDNSILLYTTNSGRNHNIEGNYVCTFKGKRKHISIIKKENKEENYCTFVDIDLLLYILTKITYILNYKYGQHKLSEDRDSNSNWDRII